MSDWTSNYNFLWELDSDIAAIRRGVAYDDDMKSIRQQLADMKKGFIEEAVKISEELQSEKEAVEKEESYSDENEDAEEFDRYDEYETTNYYRGSFTEEMTVRLNNMDVGYFYVNAGETAEQLSVKYDGNIGEWAESYYRSIINSTHYGISEEISYYVQFKENKDISVKDFRENDAKKADTYFIIKDGKLEFKGINSEIANSVFENVKEFPNINDLTLYAYLDTSKLTHVSFEELINQGIKGNNMTYSQLYDMYNRYKSTDKNIARNLIVAAVLLIVSISFALIYFEITGKKNEDEPAKQRFYDFVPFELGLSVVAAIITGLIYLFVALFSSARAAVISVTYVITVVGVISWVCLFMFCSSNARYFRSDKKARTHFLAYWLFLGVCKVILAFWHGIVFVAQKLSNAVKKIFGAVAYKPKKFKRNVILLLILLAVMNIVFLSVIVSAVAYREPVLFIIFFFPLAVIDGFVLYRVCKYIKNLDEIIDASSRHEDILTPLEKLDNSLRVLALNMKYSNSQLQAAINKAVKDERLRTELITNVSHDLKTPLTSIILYVDMLSKCDINDEKAKEYIEVLNEKGNKLKKLIDDLIEASKVTSGNVTVNPTNINLSELCLQATVEAQSDFEKNGLEMVVKAGEKQTYVFADGVKTNRIIENLLSNARKYSAKGSRVYVSVYEENGRGVFEIKNISAQPLDITPDELTERFVRGDKSRNQEGNGLGLSIAKELCALQNGELDLQIDGDLFKARVCLPQKNS